MYMSYDDFAKSVFIVFRHDSKKDTLLFKLFLKDTTKLLIIRNNLN